MSRIVITIIAIITNCQILLSQENFTVFFLNAATDSVPVYKTKTSTVSFIKIKENEQDENWHDVEIIEASSKRYKVIITSINETDVAPIEGWVNKIDCGVWLHGIKRFDTVCLYAKPRDTNPLVVLKDQNYSGFSEYTNGKTVPVKSFKLYNGDYWIKTVIKKGKKNITGWTTDYCPNTYDSCN